MAIAAAALKNAEGAKNLFREYHNDLFGKGENKAAREQEMLEYYMKHVKHVRPEARVVDYNGEKRLEVSGLKDI